MPGRLQGAWLAGLGMALGGWLLGGFGPTSPLTTLASTPQPTGRTASPEPGSEGHGLRLEPSTVLTWRAEATQGPATPGIQGEGVVDAKGMIDLGPYGSVHVAGQTTNEASYTIAKHLARHLKNPRVHLAATFHAAPPTAPAAGHPAPPPPTRVAHPVPATEPARSPVLRTAWQGGENNQGTAHSWPTPPTVFTTPPAVVTMPGHEMPPVQPVPPPPDPPPQTERSVPSMIPPAVLAPHPAFLPVAGQDKRPGRPGNGDDTGEKPAGDTDKNEKPDKDEKPDKSGTGADTTDRKDKKDKKDKKDQQLAAQEMMPPPGMGVGPGGYAGSPAPNELSKIALPPYVIEAPDILIVQYLGQALPEQDVSGTHLVRPDGSISLGIYGSVPVAGKTLEQARQLIAAQLAQKINKFDPDILWVDVYAYNSKVYYVITDGAGFGEQVYRFPITGSETVLDALANIYGLPPVADKRRVWVARRTPDGGPPKILPVDYIGTTQGGLAGTNYQIMPGDRIYVHSDCWRRADTFIAKVLSPFERIMGFTLLTSETVNSIRNSGGSGTGTGR